MMDRRRGLMAAKKQENPWEDITSTLNFVRGSNTQFTEIDDVIRVFSQVNGTYRSILAGFTTNEGYAYKVTCDRVAVNKGVGKIYCRTSENVIVSGTGTPSWTTSQVAIEKEFSHNPDIAKISLFCTWTTSEAGDVLYTAFRLWRKKL